MIWDSRYWTEELLKHARALRRRQTVKKRMARSTGGLEKNLMLGFYSIRKLIEAHKVSDEIRDRPLRLHAYAWTGSVVTFLNWDTIDAHYDLDHPVHLTKPVRWLADQFIHSYVFLPTLDENRKLDGILFNSDWTRRQHLYDLAIDEVIALFEKVAVDEPVWMESRFNERTGDHDVRLSSAMEDELSGPFHFDAFSR